MVKVLLQAGADKDVQNEVNTIICLLTRIFILLCVVLYIQEGKTALSVTKKKSIIKLFDEHGKLFYSPYSYEVCMDIV